MARDPATSNVERFVDEFQQALANGTFHHLQFGKYRGSESGLKRASARIIQLQGTAWLSFLFRYQTQDITKNVPLSGAVAAVQEQLARGFRSAQLCLMTGELHLEFNNKGEPRLRRAAMETGITPPQAATHDHAKTRLIDPASPFLQPLGVTNEQHGVLPSMARKWKQINVFVELLRDALAASPLATAPAVRVVDFGAGKGYLTFATYAFLRAQLGTGATVTGIETRPELVQLGNSVAQQTGMTQLTFVRGDLSTHAPAAIDILIALHACDTATDLALHSGIRAGATLLMCAPCCHHQIRPQLVNPPVLQPLLRFGIHQEQEAEMVTDALRVLLLEASGYETKLFEFVSPEHTGKNKMILASKRATSKSRRATALADYHALKAFYSIREHALETLLKLEP